MFTSGFLSTPFLLKPKQLSASVIFYPWSNRVHQCLADGATKTTHYLVDGATVTSPARTVESGLCRDPSTRLLDG